MHRIMISAIGILALSAVCLVVAWSTNTPLGPTTDQESIAIFSVGLVAMGVVNYLLGVAFRRRRR